MNAPFGYDSLCAFTDAYIVAAMWSSIDDGGTPLDSAHDTDDLAPETLARMRADCRSFYDANVSHIFCDGAPNANDGSGVATMAGHDFWLTRNGHGAGFWDGDWPEPAATILDEASKNFGEFNLYVGGDDMVYGS